MISARHGVAATWSVQGMGEPVLDCFNSLQHAKDGIIVPGEYRWFSSLLVWEKAWAESDPNTKNGYEHRWMNISTPLDILWSRSVSRWTLSDLFKVQTSAPAYILTTWGYILCFSTLLFHVCPNFLKPLHSLMKIRCSQTAAEKSAAEITTGGHWNTKKVSTRAPHTLPPFDSLVL